MAKIVLNFGLDTMVPSAKDKLIAPKISTLSAPQIPDLSAERKYLLGVFVLNFDLSMTVSNKHRQLLFNIIRKAEDGLDEYCRAAEKLRLYLSERGRRLSAYFDAVRGFEQCLAHLYQAVCCLNALTKGLDGTRQFGRNDGSILERVYLMHSEIKHMDERFVTGDVADETSFMLFSRADTLGTSAASMSNIPMWLTDAGLECAKCSIAYSELAQELRELSQQAKTLATLKANVATPPSGLQASSS